MCNDYSEQNHHTLMFSKVQVSFHPVCLFTFLSIGVLLSAPSDRAGLIRLIVCLYVCYPSLCLFVCFLKSSAHSDKAGLIRV